MQLTSCLFFIANILNDFQPKHDLNIISYQSVIVAVKHFTQLPTWRLQSFFPYENKTWKACLGVWKISLYKNMWKPKVVMTMKKSLQINKVLFHKKQCILVYRLVHVLVWRKTLWKISCFSRKLLKFNWDCKALSTNKKKFYKNHQSNNHYLLLSQQNYAFGHFERKRNELMNR